MKLTIAEKKRVKDYMQFESKAIKKSPVSNLLLPQQPLWVFLLLWIGMCFTSCKTDYVANNIVYGTLAYSNVLKDTLLVPAAQNVDVFLNGGAGSIYSFKTTETGKYRFIPTIEGDILLDLAIQILCCNTMLRW